MTKLFYVINYETMNLVNVYITGKLQARFMMIVTELETASDEK